VLVDGVYDTLLSFLMSGTLAPGDPIGIEWLSRSLEVSPTPIREALARIEGTGLIVREPLRGYRVGPRMSPKEFSDLMEARLLIEPYSAAAACRHRDDALLEELSGILAEMRAAPTGPGYQEFRTFLRADAQFHKTIAAHSGNHYINEAFDRLGAHLHRFRLFGGAGVTDAVMAVQEHEAILSSIAQRSASGARKAMAYHIRAVLQRAVQEQQLVQEEGSSANREPGRRPLTRQRLVAPV
jgi:DNA-binding GntR family transcriptional regulator